MSTLLKVVQRHDGSWDAFEMSRTDITPEQDWKGYAETNRIKWMENCNNNDNKIVDGVFVPNHVPDREYWLDGEEHTLIHPEELPEGATFEKPVEVLIREVKGKRFGLLSDSDKHALKYDRLCRLNPDNVEYKATRKEIDLYRQALCDIPEQEGFPENVTFPDPPPSLQQEV